KVEIRLHRIIYALIEEIQAAMKGMLAPTMVEKITGQVEIRKLFKVSKIGTIAGCMVTDGVIKNNSLIRLMRDGVVIYEGKLGSLQREKDAVKEVKAGFECGLTIDGYNDEKEGDIIEGYEIVEEK
ncbi:MAG: translation initiation factor IF-2, partial [Bacilli bacterium]|nr:translation initiation factor IF-2 [Bacilli bacterium]